MSSTKPAIYLGLDGIYVKETEISYIDGIHGKLYYRGYPIETLVEKSNFEEVTFLLLYGRLPKKAEFEDFKMRLRMHRNLPKEIINFMQNLPRNISPMNVLMSIVSILSAYDLDTSSQDIQSMLRVAEKIIAKIPTIVAYWYRIKNNLKIIPPNEKFDHAANFLYMVFGKKPNPYFARIMDIMLILHAEHGMNASTFANLVAASTLTDLYSAVIAGIAALKGRLHGGASTLALKTIVEIGFPEKAEKIIRQKLLRKERIFGFGHRVYKTYDPRARILKKIAKELLEKTGMKKSFETAEAIEKVVIKLLGKTKKIYTNIDFYSGLIYKALGFEPEYFPAIFTIARVVGWLAHTIEYWKRNKLIRPRAYYKGTLNKEYISLELR